MLNVKSLKYIQLSFTCGFPSLALVPKILLTVLFSFSLFIHRNYVVLAQPGFCAGTSSVRFVHRGADLAD